MMRSTLLAGLLLLLAAGPAGAAPVSTGAVLEIDGLGFSPVPIAGSGTITVSGSTVIVPAGLVALTSKITVPVTASTALTGLRLLTGVANRPATFRIGGVTSQVPSERCPGSGNNTLGVACNQGGGLGGVMSLTGTILFIGPRLNHAIPLNLNAALLGQGGSTNVPLQLDAAAWSTGTGWIDGESERGALSPLTLISPTFVQSSSVASSFFMTFTLTAVPEPAALVLIGAGVAGLALLRRRSGS